MRLKSVTAILLVLAMVIAVVGTNDSEMKTVQASSYFADVKTGSVGEAEIDFAYEKGIIGGFGKDKQGRNVFKPDKPVTRAQFAIMLYKTAEALGYIKDSGKTYSCSFKDIKRGNSGYNEVAWANANGIINGFSSTTFKPNNYISRAQITMMLMKLAEFSGEDTANRIENASDYVDYKFVSDSFKNSVKWAMAEGIMSGKTKRGFSAIDPDGNATRAMCAIFICRYYNKQHIMKKDIQDGYDKMLEEQERRKEEGLYTNTSIKDIQVYDSKDALYYLDAAKLGDGISYENEYSLIDVVTSPDGDMVMANQKVGDLPVFGATLTIYISNSGYVTGILGSHIEKEFFDKTVNVGTDAAFDTAKEHIKSVLGIESDPMIGYRGRCYIKENVEDTLYRKAYIYNGYAENDDCGIYGEATVIVSAYSGSVVYESSNADAAMETVNRKGQQVDQTFEVDHTDGNYYLYDTGRNIYICNAGKDSNWEDNFNNNVGPVIMNNPYKVVSCWADDDSFNNGANESSIDAMANLQRVYDFYKEKYDRKGRNEENYLIVITDIVGNGTKGNAFNRGDRIITVGLPGKNDVTLSAFLDAMAHEYTHGVIHNEVSKHGEDTSKGTLDFKSMNEGLSDILGDICEDYSDDTELNNSNDMKYCIHRDFSESLLCSEFKKDRYAEEHDGSHIITHHYYLMRKGINGDSNKIIGNDKLAYLYYDMIKRLDTEDRFTDYRDKMEMLIYQKGEFGDKYRLTDKQIDTVVDAFEMVGIDSGCSYKIKNNGKILICGKDEKLHYDTSIEILNMNGEKIYEKNLWGKGYFYISNAELTTGSYRVRVLDNKTKTGKEFTIAVNDDNDCIVDTRPYEDTIAVFLDTSNNYRPDYDWQNLPLSQLPSYISGKAKQAEIEDFLPYLPGYSFTRDPYQGRHAEGFRYGLTEEEAVDTLSCSLSFGTSYWKARRKNYYEYLISDVNRCAKAFSDIDIKYTLIGQSPFVIYSGDYIKVQVAQAGQINANITKAEINNKEICIHYYLDGEGDGRDYWKAYFIKGIDGYFKLFSTAKE